VENGASILKLSELERKELFPGARARFVHSDHMTLAHWEFEAGVLLPEHSHPHEQITNILDGVFELTIEGRPHRLEADMMAVIPPDARHSGKAITDCRLFDVFYPVREDFR
jgi:quercetin dioxygenase-like cupin family protein